jgi:hypothetical protein
LTQLLDRPIATGATLYPQAGRDRVERQDAEDFYLQPGPSAPKRQIFIQLSAAQGNLRWLADHVQNEVNAMLALGDGWDGHRAKPITEEAVGSTIGLVFALCDDLSLPPQFFPLPDGGVQIEWHVGGEAMEVEIDRSGDAHGLATDRAGAVIFDSSLEPTAIETLLPVQTIVRRLSIRAASGR